MILNLNSQIIWVFVDLLILFVLMKKFLFGPITQMLDDRAQQVSDTLAKIPVIREKVIVKENRLGLELHR